MLQLVVSRRILISLVSKTQSCALMKGFVMRSDDPRSHELFRVDSIHGPNTPDETTFYKANALASALAGPRQDSFYFPIAPEPIGLG